MRAGVLVFALAVPTGANLPSTMIDTVSKLNEYIILCENSTSCSDAGRSVGFLSSGNYQSVAPLLPKSNDTGNCVTSAACPLIPQYFGDLQHLEDAVLNGTIVAGLSSSRPQNTNNRLSEFKTGMVTLKAPLFRRNDADSEQIRQAFDAATIRAVSAGSYQQIEQKYYESNSFETTAAFTCGIAPDNYPFPVAGGATGALSAVLSRGSLRVAAIGPSNWGYQGDYTLANPTGFWPEYVAAMFAQFQAAYPAVTFERVFFPGSAQVMEAVLNGSADMSEPYFNTNGWYTTPGTTTARSRTEVFDLGCSVLGTEDVFFTAVPVPAGQRRVAPDGNAYTRAEFISNYGFHAWNSATVAPPESLVQNMTPQTSGKDELSAGVIAAIIVCSVVAFGLAVAITFLILKEKAGKPVFHALATSDDVVAQSNTQTAPDGAAA